MLDEKELNSLRRLSQLSLEMEDVLGDLRHADIDTNEIESNVQQTTAYIQDLLNENGDDPDV
jgi:hypothetical protein